MEDLIKELIINQKIIIELLNKIINNSQNDSKMNKPFIASDLNHLHDPFFNDPDKRLDPLP